LQTAQEVAAGSPIALEPRLRERHHGELQGLTRLEMAQKFPDLAAALGQHQPGYQPPGGESIESFADRVHAALADLQRQYAGKTLLVLAHGGVLDITFRLASGQDLYSPRRHVLPNAALNWLVAGPHGWHAEAIGLIDHLERDAQDDVG
jgi:probable phosphoglycerate mutase